MEPIIYISGQFEHREELNAASKYFEVVTRRTLIPKNKLVIPRFTALPYNKELCEDIEYLGSKIINSHREHEYVADLQNWYQDLEGLTPKTWFDLSEIPKHGKFVLKGATNSKKFLWNTHMFADDRTAVNEVYKNLLNDGHIGTQRIYIREYVELNKLAQGFNGLPISEEYRFFVLNGEVVDAGFYWSSHVDDLEKSYDPFKEVPKEIIQEVIQKISPNIRFFVFDAARKQNGDWTIIELNDGQQSGLSEINADNFYSNLRKML